jgi:hypothetical protein
LDAGSHGDRQSYAEIAASWIRVDSPFVLPAGGLTAGAFVLHRAETRIRPSTARVDDDELPVLTVIEIVTSKAGDDGMTCARGATALELRRSPAMQDVRIQT